MKIKLSSLNVSPGGIAVCVAPHDRWGDLAQAFSTMKVPAHLQGTPVLFLEPGEKISSLSAEELAAAGLKRI